MRRSRARTDGQSTAALASIAPVVGVIALGVGLYVLSNYLSARFDHGAPVTHSVNQYLTIWLSIAAVGVIGLASLGAGLAQATGTGPVRPRRNRQRPRTARFA